MFRGYVEYHVNAANKFERRSPVTIKAYYNRYLLVTQFLQNENLLNIRGEEFKVSLAKKYLNYLLDSYSHNYAARCVDIVSSVLDFGVNNELINFNPLSSYSIRKLPPKKPTYYTPAQILKWEAYKSPSTLKQKAAHLFVLIMHTGFDYGDLSEVGRHHIVDHCGKRYIVKPRHKNGKEAIIPLSEKAEELLELYDYKMKLISNPKFNQAIKEIAREMGLHSYLTVKTGRKICAMNMLNNKGFGMSAVSKILGHSSVKTTEQTYAQVNISLVHSEIERLSW
jgi:site-specific recombinase XerD